MRPFGDPMSLRRVDVSRPEPTHVARAPAAWIQLLGPRRVRAGVSEEWTSSGGCRLPRTSSSRCVHTLRWLSHGHYLSESPVRAMAMPDRLAQGW
jgi:hypothetical protein